MPERSHRTDSNSAASPNPDAGESRSSHAAAGPGRAEELALESLSLRFRPVLLNFFLRRVKDLAEAEDLAQEVFMRMLRRGNISFLEHARAYLFETASSVLLDRARRRSVRHSEVHERFDAAVHGGEDFPCERVLVGQETLDRAFMALLELPERTRTVFVLRRLESLRYQDIVRRLSISVSAVEKHMVRAVTYLTERMGADC